MIKFAFQSSHRTHHRPEKVVIVSAVRTPIGSFMGGLSTVEAPRLGAVAIKGALNKIQLDANLVDEIFMGCVIQAGLGQAPTRQAAIHARFANSVICTTVNKVCASGMKSVMMGAQAIQCGDAEIVVAGGMENMSLIPHYIHLRNGHKFWPRHDNGRNTERRIDRCLRQQHHGRSWRLVCLGIQD